MCTVLCAVGFALYCVPWFKKIRSYISVFARVSSHSVYVLLSFSWFLTSLPYSLRTYFPPCVLLYLLLPLAFPGIFSFLWLPSSLPHLPFLPPAITACRTGMTEPSWGTMPLQAWMHPTMHVCIHKCVSVCACAYVIHSDCGHRLFLGENTDAAFCFCSCFTLRFVLLMLW